MQFLPKQIKILKTSKNIIIKICGEEYNLCDYYSKKMWVNNKKSNKESKFYNQGILNSKKDQYKTERVGRLGEIALAKIINKPVNFNYIKNGDNEDFIVDKSSVEIKTANHNYGKILIRKETSKGNLIPINFDIIVGAYIVKENIVDKSATICLVGYEYKNNIVNFPLRKAMRGQHKNIEIYYNYLKPFKRNVK